MGLSVLGSGVNSCYLYTEDVNAVDNKIKLTQEHLEETVSPSWAVQYTLKKTEASCTEIINIKISTCC